MALKKKAQKTTKSVSGSAVSNSLDTALAAIEKANADTAAAVKSVGTDKTKLTKESQRLAKKRATLSRKLKAAKAKLKKDAGADNRKALKAVEKELAANKKESTKVNAAKSKVTAELAELKQAARRAGAYTKAIATADKVLNKPQKKRRKKKAKAA